MPNIMEISGLLNGRMGRLSGKVGAVRGLRNLKAALGKPKKAKKASRPRPISQKAARALPGPNAERALEVAERMFNEGKKPLAIAWARQAEKKAIAEGKPAIKARAQELIKMVRGEAAAKLMAGFGDVDGIVMGRLMGLW